MLSIKNVSETLHFKTHDQSMWSSGSALRIDENWTLFSESLPDTTFSALDGDLTADASASVAVVLDVKGDSGGISLDYPLNISFSAPSHVAAGQQFTVQTTNDGLDSGSPHFKAVFPSLDVDLKAIFKLDIDATFDSELVPDTPVSFGTSYDLTRQLLRVGSGESKHLDEGLFQFEITVPAHYDSALDRESVAGSAVSDSVTLDVTTGNFADVSVDLLTLLEDLVGPEFPDLEGSVLDGDLTYDLLSVDLVLGIAITQQFQFVPVQINVTLTTPWNDSVTVPLGSAATFQAPAGWTGDSEIKATYSILGNLISQTGFVGDASLDLTALAGAVDLPEAGLVDSFGPLFQDTFPLYTTAPFYIYTAGGSGGFTLNGFNSVTHNVQIAHGDGKFTGPGGVAIGGAHLFNANAAALMQSVMNDRPTMTGTNLYNPATGSGIDAAEINKLDVAEFSTPNVTANIPTFFDVGLVTASGVALTGGVGTLLLAAAPGAGGTATLTAGANEMMVAGQEGDVIFNISVQKRYEGTLVGLNAGDQINLQNFSAAEVFLQGSNLVFVTDNDDFYILELSGDYSDINFVLNSSNVDNTNVVLTSTDSNVVGKTAVALQGSTTSTWSQETNLGDLTADSMRSALTNASGGLSVPDASSPAPVVSLRTASSIWTGISGTANPETGKPAGGISQYDIEHTLPSDHKLMVFDTTAAGLKAILEHAVAAGTGQSRFAQVGGLRFSYDLDERAGSRIKSIALIDESGIVTARVVEDGVVSGTPPARISVVTTSNVANGSDGYTLKALGDNFHYLLAAGGLSAAIDESLDFTDAANIPAGALGEQQALTDHLARHHADAATAFAAADTPAALDMRVQDVGIRADQVFLGRTLTAGDSGGVLTGSPGDDTLQGGAGSDTLSGRDGADAIDLGAGKDLVRDNLADLTGDRIGGFGVGDSLQIDGPAIGRDGFAFDRQAGKVVVTAGGESFELGGDFSGGDFMAVARGSGTEGQTTVTFVPYLPTLTEGVRVDPASINGVANLPFLTGDGTAAFTLELESTTSAYRNALGTYRVAVDGTISDVHLLFANTLSVADHSVDLGTPGEGEMIGFFLVQDAVGRYGTLIDDLRFVGANGQPADLDSGLSPVLVSASRGHLVAAPVWHSFATLNPNDAEQVLSGVAPGGRELQVGFEDVLGGDNDYQDVVLNVRVSYDFLTA